MQRRNRKIFRNCAALALLGLLSSCQTSKLPDPSAHISTAARDPYPYQIVKKKSPELLSLKELTTVLEDPKASNHATKKAERLMSSPFIDNTHYYRHGLPKPNIYPELGPCLRVSTWNIEKSINVAEATKSLTSASVFEAQLRPEVRKSKKARNTALRQRLALATSDVLLLQEMDIGHCRSGHLFAAKHIAQKMGMNFVYAPQQLEIDPVHLGVQHIMFPNSSVDQIACHATHGDPDDYKGVFGTAVLSRYPIKRVQVFPLKHQPYDWYADEIKKPDFVEKGRKFGIQTLFGFRPTREVKAGGRGFTRVDLHVPDVPHETLTVINIHLEIKTTPSQRKKQLEEILGYINEVENPVVLAGDFNSASRDVSSTSFGRLTKRTATNPTNIFSATLWLANITGINQLRGLLNFTKNFRDPLAPNIPIIFPNNTRSLFAMIKNYRFKDGGAFDFRGDRKHSTYKNAGPLSNSNQRYPFKGYTFTFNLPKPIGPFGRERLDWILVKSFLTDPVDKKGPYKLAPHYGETLSLFNYGVTKRFSDHHPITTLLPLEEPEP